MVHLDDDPDRRPPPPAGGDPRLEIPEVLRERPDAKPAPKPAGNRPQPTAMAETARAWGVALDFVITTVTGALLGWLLDRWLGTGPWGAVVGLALGFVTAFLRIIRYSRQNERRERLARERERQRRNNPPPNTP